MRGPVQNIEPFVLVSSLVFFLDESVPINLRPGPLDIEFPLVFASHMSPHVM